MQCSIHKNYTWHIEYWKPNAAAKIIWSFEFWELRYAVELFFKIWIVEVGIQ